MVAEQLRAERGEIAVASNSQVDEGLRLAVPARMGVENPAFGVIELPDANQPSIGFNQLPQAFEKLTIPVVESRRSDR